MSWKTKSVTEQKLLFIKMWQSDNYTMAALCDRFDISRTTGHKLVKRFIKEGGNCLVSNEIYKSSSTIICPTNLTLK